jgi:ribonuclease P protein component
MYFSAHQRLRKAKDFEELRKSGWRMNCGSFVLVIAQQDLGPTRFGVIASRRVGNAVKRNRAKRIFREIFRLNQGLFPPSSAVLVVVRSGFDHFSFEELKTRFVQACRTYNHEK